MDTNKKRKEIQKLNERGGESEMISKLVQVYMEMEILNESVEEKYGYKECFGYTGNEEDTVYTLGGGNRGCL